ncbi:hypothetical protein [Candidatus Albibeggiatoa sp. nov. NOAA]|uniref:hypothetical protein n=1 Tax=Candidatus Albibeggiatoa sp. nov. NOAA TaxID=3162724 RepID=UPI0032F77937|nr:hypothetical protein [Thiotrichaceae bacterium]
MEIVRKIVLLLTILLLQACVKITEYDYSNVPTEVQDASFKQDQNLYETFLEYFIKHHDQHDVELPPQYSEKRYKFGFISHGHTPFSKHRYPLNIDMDLYFPNLDTASFRISMRQVKPNGAIEILEVKSRDEWDAGEIPLQTFYIYKQIPQTHK